jgi:hypothetical protein
MSTVFMKIANYPVRDWRKDDQLMFLIDHNFFRVKLDSLPPVGGCNTVAVKVDLDNGRDFATVCRNAYRIARGSPNSWTPVRIKEWRVVRNDTNLSRVSTAEETADPNQAFGAFHNVPVVAWRQLSPGIRGAIKRNVDYGCAPQRPHARPLVGFPRQPPQPEPQPAQPPVQPTVQPPTDLPGQIQALQAALDLVKNQAAKIDEQMPTCPVCYEPNKTPTVFSSCGHAYCAGCAPVMAGRQCGMCRIPLIGAAKRVFL